jgi:penicillin-binding protein 2
MSQYLKKIDKDWYRQRVTWGIVWLLTAFIVLFARLFYLQVIEGQEYRRLSDNNCIRLQSMDAPRGLIFDRNGRLLVDNRPSFDLFIVLKDAKPIEETLNKLNSYTGFPVDELVNKIKQSKEVAPFKPILLKQDIGRDLMAVIEVHKFDLPGISIQVRPMRHYINEMSAAHILGYLGEIGPDELKQERFQGCVPGDYVGKFGSEKSFEPLLRGSRGGRQVEVNATGQMVRVIKTVDAEPGDNLYLTIDQDLQNRAESLLRGISGAVVALNPNNGHVLAMASSPSFDQNAFVAGLNRNQWKELVSNPRKPMSNKAIQGEYPPASTYKIITAMAGLEEGVIDENTPFFCPGYYQFGDRTFRCWKKGGHGSVNVVKALAESCDVFFYQVGLKLGVDRLAWYAKACGLGEETGIQLDHEGQGLVPTAAWKSASIGASWQRGETISVAIGQGYNLATPVQLAVLTAAIANGGARYKPLILEKIINSEGAAVENKEREILGKLPVSAKNMEIIRRGLWEVVNSDRGTARIAHLANVDVSGKTGTAQVFSRKGGETTKEERVASHLKSHAWFIAYAPSKNPKIAMSVIVEHGEHGSSAAAPVARDLIDSFFNAETDYVQPTAQMEFQKTDRSDTGG